MSRKVNLDLERGPVGIGLRKVSQLINFDEFTDGASTAGTLNLNKQIPAGSIVMFSKVTTKVGFIGDTSAAMIIGIAGDTDRYSLADYNVLAAASQKVANIDGAAGAVAAPDLVISDTTVVVTVTGASDFGLITSGQAYVEIVYFSTNPEIIDIAESKFDL